MYYRTPTNYDYLSEDYEVNSSPSLTVPDDSWTIKEILARFTQGIPCAVSHRVDYDEDDDLDYVNPVAIDLVDIVENQAKIDSLRESLEKLEAEQAEIERLRSEDISESEAEV